MIKFFSLLFAVVMMVTLANAQDVPTSVGPAPVSDIKVTPQEPTPFAVGTRYFSQISSSPTFQFGKAFLESCTITNIGAPFTITFPGGLVMRNGVVYTWNQSSPFQLWSIDTVTGTHTLVFNITGVPSSNFTGMTWDGTTMYGVATSITQSQLFTINMTTGASTPIGTLSSVCAGAISLSGRLGAANGLFCVDIVADNLYRVNKGTGVFTLVGPLGGNANFGQDAQFDNNDGKLYWMSYTTGPQLRVLDTATGTAGPVLCTYSNQACGIAPVMAGAPPVSFVPDYLYYKFENNPNSTTVLNCAVPGVGTPTAPLGSGTPLNSGGQFDSCISGTGLSTGKVTTGWNCNLGTSSWTISMWITIPSTSSGSAYYLFGDAGSTSFRCFHNGVALQDNLVLRGPITDVTVTGIGPAPTVVTFVYDSAGANIKAYKNGVLAVTSNQTVNIPTGSGFHVGGYGSSTSFIGKMDEFRLYHRALTAAQVLAMYNSDPGGCGITGIVNTNNEIPNNYSLKQNYPNPFNPVTRISFSIPNAGMTKLVVYDMLGRRVNTLVESDLKAGNYDVTFNALNMASGTYFYTLTSGNYVETKKMVIVK